MGVPPMSPMGVPPMDSSQNTGKMPVLLTGKMPVLLTGEVSNDVTQTDRFFRPEGPRAFGRGRKPPESRALQKEP